MLLQAFSVLGQSPHTTLLIYVLGIVSLGRLSLIRKVVLIRKVTKVGARSESTTHRLCGSIFFKSRSKFGVWRKSSTYIGQTIPRAPQKLVKDWEDRLFRNRISISKFLRTLPCLVCMHIWCIPKVTWRSETTLNYRTIDGGEIPKSQGRGWRFDSQLWNFFYTWWKICQVVNCLLWFGDEVSVLCLKKEEKKIT